MSQAPQNLPTRTRILVKDILFQEKYRLTHTQIDVMAYIINAFTIRKFWVYLHENPDKIGKVIDFNRELTLEELNNH